MGGGGGLAEISIAMMSGHVTRNTRFIYIEMDIQEVTASDSKRSQKSILGSTVLLGQYAKGT